MTAAEALPMTQKVVTGTIATLIIYFAIVVLYFSLNFWQNCLFELSLSHSFHASICILMPDPLKGVDSIAYTHTSSALLLKCKGFRRFSTKFLYSWTSALVTGAPNIGTITR